ncbi:hypothetical protein QFC22_001362 [Naganishia vaughanmartiniae]|uniref:Uncharacterized protein n=1 Tax=Naganishia vaughanmartiniae TaxID=1424756 RepID=A0ACC2XIA2_9TREE|nr:hypothetical protein QFC22_001362 [Naganishia vaughanmartiniae]
MKYTDFLRQLVSLAQAEDGPALALRLSHSGKHSARLLAATSSIPETTIHAQGEAFRRSIGGGEGDGWIAIGEAFVKALKAREAGEYQGAYKAQAAVVGGFLGRLQGEGGWCLGVLYALLADLRWLAAVVSLRGRSPRSSRAQRESDSSSEARLMRGRFRVRRILNWARRMSRERLFFASIEASAVRPRVSVLLSSEWSNTLARPS